MKTFESYELVVVIRCQIMEPNVLRGNIQKEDKYND